MPKILFNKVEGVMHMSKPVGRTLRLRSDEFVALWTIALWTLAAAYLLTTFTID